MKTIRVLLIDILLSAALSACSSGSTFPAFNGSRTGNDTQLIMQYSAFNMTDSQKLSVNAGETIHVELVVEGGCLSYEIQKEDDPIAAGHEISASEAFDVKAEESGTYTVTVTGEKAKGSVRVVVKRSAQDGLSGHFGSAILTNARGVRR